MSRIREVVARMAADPAFAEQVRSHPDEVAQGYGLSPDEIDKLRGLAEADSQSGPVPLGARLSKSGIGGGVLAGLLAGVAQPADGADVKGMIIHDMPDPGDGAHADARGIIIHDMPDPDAFDYGIPDTGPEGFDPGAPTPNDGLYGAPDTQPVPNDGLYGAPDTEPVPNDGLYGAPETGPVPEDGAYGTPVPNDGAYGIPVPEDGLPVPEDGAYDGPDIKPSGDAVPDGGARGIIIHAAPDPESSDVNVELTPEAANLAQAFTPSESEQENTI